MVDFRPATMDDGDYLFAWRNDAQARQFSRATEMIRREDHDRWMQFNVGYGYPQHLVMIAETEDGPIGMVRFDAEKSDVMAYRVSITLAPRFRGRGLSSGILAGAIDYMREYALHAEIKESNAASRRIFEKCGFTEFRKVAKDGFIEYRREPQS